MTTARVLVTAEQVRELAGAVLLDVRWALGDSHGYRHYLDGHLPGAVFVDLETELAAPASAEAGRHPLPELGQLQAAARRWGIGDTDTTVVVYDATGGLAAARAWWLLRWGGISDVRILDGGLDAWIAIGGELSTVPVTAEPGTVTLTAGGMPVLDIDEAARWPAHGVLLDARATARYRGEVEPVDPRAGHIPGAYSAPTTENLDSDHRFAAPERLRARFAEYGAGPFAVYCGSGVTAAHQIAALSAAGIDAALYPGSWSQWAADSTRSIATGDAP